MFEICGVHCVMTLQHIHDTLLSCACWLAVANTYGYLLTLLVKWCWLHVLKNAQLTWNHCSKSSYILQDPLLSLNGTTPPQLSVTTNSSLQRNCYQSTGASFEGNTWWKPQEDNLNVANHASYSNLCSCHPIKYLLPICQWLEACTATDKVLKT